MLILSVDGGSVLRGFSGGGLGDALPLVRGHDGAELSPLDALTDWAARYERAVEAGSDLALGSIGAEMLDWLDQGSALEDWLAGVTREIEIRVEPGQSGELTDALLDAPWEVLCREGVFLADGSGLFSVARRCGGNSAPPDPAHSDLSLMFMAAAPEGQLDLDYEREEASILEATLSGISTHGTDQCD